MALSTVATADAVTVPSDQFPTNKFPENETIIWRYMDVASFAWLLQTKCLLFRREDKFSDKHEGVLSRPTLRRLVHEMEERIEISLSKTGESLSNETARAMAIELERGYMDEARRQFYVNCWHASDVESFAMWHE